MINKLRDCHLNDHIIDIVEIIKHNNSQIQKEFDNIYDSSLNYIKKSIYSPVGYVESYFGDFDELQAEYFTVSNTSSLKASIYSEVIKGMKNKSLPHNQMDGRWSSDDVAVEYDERPDLTHDASSIVYAVEDGHAVSLYDKIKSVQTGNDVTFYDPITDTSASIQDLGELIQWKDSLTTAPLQITNSLGQTKTYKVVCTSITQPEYSDQVNTMLNSILGTDTDSPEYSQNEIDDLIPMVENIINGEV